MTPTSEIVAVSARGLLMGNRGCLHGPDRKLGVPRWRSKAWLCCVLAYKDVQRDPMPPGRWTALFFLDEATALAAGHRPCGFCRRASLAAFADAWRRARALQERPRAPELDNQLHSERVHSRTRRQLTRQAMLYTLPDGAMVRLDDATYLVVRGRLLRWSFLGYSEPQVFAPTTTVEVLTPASTVATLAAGYQPMIHPSARAMQLRVAVAIEKLQLSIAPTQRSAIGRNLSISNGFSPGG
ncbi:hypothetical protein Rhe02_60390 [Rhizocola hellebori]|uniref:Uncharacterized protein n=1 Tax=Rhizocola hellebori TaxID=1392758 RepID=A0A8J3QE57_9ACTN|nr:hypothetical protein Rhe02_60390 [Rhizocola hellebori]